MAVNIGTLAAGIGSGIKNISTTIPTIQSQMQQAVLRGAQEAKLRQAILQADEDRNNLKASQDYYAQQMGIPVEAVRGYSPQELAQMFSNTQKGQMLRAAGILSNPETVARAVQAAQQVQAPEQAPAPTETSTSDSAAVTPPISALRLGGQQASQQSAEQAYQQNAAVNTDLLNRLIATNARINHAMSGGPEYQNSRNGVAFNPYTGTSNIYDQAAYDANQKYIKAKTNKANRPPQKRGGGGGGHGRGRVTWGKPYTAADGSERQNGSNGSVKVISRPRKDDDEMDDWYQSVELY